MILKPENNVLVIAGGWNANILLNTEWLRKYLFPDDENLTLEIPVGTNLLPHVCSESVRISLGGLRLCLAPLNNEDDTLDYIETLGAKIADHLPHTPVTAFGVNFAFEVESGDPTPVLDTSYSEAISSSVSPIKELTHGYSFSDGEARVKLTVRKPESGMAVWDFNFEHTIKTLRDFKGIIAERSLREFKTRAESILKSIATSAEARTEAQV